MLQGGHSAILSTFIMLPFVFKIFVLSIFEWPLKTGFTVLLSVGAWRLFCFLNSSMYVIYVTVLRALRCHMSITVQGHLPKVF